MNPKIFLTLIAILYISFLGCERVQQVTTPETHTPDATSTIKIGVIQPSGLASSFTKGAELARSQVNNTGGLLGMQVEFIVMDNQGDREFPDPDESVRIAKALIQEEGVVAIRSFCMGLRCDVATRTRHQKCRNLGTPCHSGYLSKHD